MKWFENYFLINLMQITLADKDISWLLLQSFLINEKNIDFQFILEKSAIVETVEKFMIYNFIIFYIMVSILACTPSSIYVFLPLSKKLLAMVLSTN